MFLIPFNLEFLNPLSRETAKISSNAEKSILYPCSQLTSWPSPACMIEPYSECYLKGHNLCRKKKHISSQSKCKNHILLRTLNRSKLVKLNLKSILLNTNKSNSSWLWSMSTAKSQTLFTGTKCLKS